MKRSSAHLESSSNSEVTTDDALPKRGCDNVILDDEIVAHPDFKYELDLIMKKQKRRLFEAERNRNMQIKNIHALYEFEVVNIEAATKLACDEAKAQVRENLLEDREAKAASVEAKMLLQKKSGIAIYPPPQSDIASSEDNAQDRRRLRSLSMTDNGLASTAGFEETIADLRKSTKKCSVQDKKTIPTSIIPGMPSILLNRKTNGGRRTKIFNDDILQNILTEDEVRDDFVRIVHHLEGRAMTVLSQKEPQTTVEAHINEETLTVTVPPLTHDLASHTKLKSASKAGQRAATSESISMQYRTGSMVVVRSSTSAEDLSGTITVISAEKDDIIVRMHTGPRLRVPLSQVRCGRVSIGRDVEAYRDIALIMAARGQYAEMPEA